MTSNEHKSRDLALRGIGRNVVAFQKMEAMLKFLVAHQKIEGLPDQLQEQLDSRVNEAQRQTMGTLVNRFFQEVAAPESKPLADESVVDEAFSISFKVELTDEDRKEIKDAFKLVVDERNALIHQMLADFKPNSPESCHALIQVLESQREKLRPHYNYLRSVVEAIFESRKQLADYFSSDEFLTDHQPDGDSR